MIRIVDYPSILFIFLFLVYAVALEIGFRLASRGREKEDPDLHEQAVGVRDGVIVLLSLLLGFTLALALPRYDLRRQLIVDEANAIGTTDLRAQMLPEPARGKSLELLRNYVDARVEFSETGGIPGASDAATAQPRIAGGTVGPGERRRHRQPYADYVDLRRIAQRHDGSRSEAHRRAAQPRPRFDLDHALSTFDPGLLEFRFQPAPPFPAIDGRRPAHDFHRHGSHRRP